MKINISKFCFYFCLQYALIIPFYDFPLSFLKTVLESTFYGPLQGKLYLLLSIILKKRNTHSPFLDNLCIPHSKSSICLCAYEINIINVFRNVNLALYMVTIIHSIETWKQMEVVRRFEREGNQVWYVMMKMMSNDETE